MKKKEIQDLKKELEEIRSILLLKSPFFASLFRRCRIIADEKVSRASVTEKEMRINPKFFNSLSRQGKIFVYCHEAGHLAFRHMLRLKNKDLRHALIAADCPINHILLSGEFENVKLPIDIVTPKSIAKMLFLKKLSYGKLLKKEEEIAKMSVEEVYSLLKKHADKLPPLNLMEDLGKTSSGKDSGVIIQEGDPENTKTNTPEEIEKFWKEVVAKATVEARMAGNLPGNLERLIDGLFESRVSWKEIIKKEIINGLGKMIISDWKRPSRRYKDLPGIKKLTIPNAWFLIDTSGSIDEDELKQFLSEVYSILKNRGKGIIIPWDARAYPQIELKKPKDIELPLYGIPGGGGTNISPVLKDVLKKMNLGDMVIVLTDGYISDIDEAATKDFFKKVSQKSSTAIFATIQAQIDLPLRWKRVKI